jgi:hypothetical protein
VNRVSSDSIGRALSRCWAIDRPQVADAWSGPILALAAAGTHSIKQPFRMMFDESERKWSIAREPKQGAQMLCDIFVRIVGYALVPSSNDS